MAPPLLKLDDIRLTTRYSEADLESIFHTSHEFGHGTYEYGIDRELPTHYDVVVNTDALPPAAAAAVIAAAAAS